MIFIDRHQRHCIQNGVHVLETLHINSAFLRPQKLLCEIIDVLSGFKQSNSQIDFMVFTMGDKSVNEWFNAVQK